MSNIIEELAQNWLNATGNQIEETNFKTLQELGVSILQNDMTCGRGDVSYSYEIPKHLTKSGHAEILNFDPEYDDLVDLRTLGLAEIVDTTAESTVDFYDVQGCEFVVLYDQSVMTRCEDNSFPEGAFWPYEE